MQAARRALLRRWMRSVRGLGASSAAVARAITFSVVIGPIVSYRLPSLSYPATPPYPIPCSVLSCPLLSYATLSYPIPPHPIPSHPMPCHAMPSYPSLLSCPVLSCPHTHQTIYTNSVWCCSNDPCRNALDKSAGPRQHACAAAVRGLPAVETEICFEQLLLHGSWCLWECRVSRLSKPPAQSCQSNLVAVSDALASLR